MLRSLRVWPYYEFLDRYLLSFIDDQDSKKLILTPILLHIGVFLVPLIAYPWCSSLHSKFQAPLASIYFAGIQAVGIGDTFAALIGVNYGRNKWPMGNGRKSLEGSCGMFFSQIIIIPMVFGLEAFTLGLFASTAVNTILEAYLKNWDNFLLSVISSGCYYFIP